MSKRYFHVSYSHSSTKGNGNGSTTIITTNCFMNHVKLNKIIKEDMPGADIVILSWDEMTEQEYNDWTFSPDTPISDTE